MAAATRASCPFSAMCQRCAVSAGRINSLASQLRGERRIAAAFTGDGSTSEGDFHEAVNLAAAQMRDTRLDVGGAVQLAECHGATVDPA